MAALPDSGYKFESHPSPILQMRASHCSTNLLTWLHPDAPSFADCLSHVLEMPPGDQTSFFVRLLPFLMQDATEADAALLTENGLPGDFMSYIFAPLAAEAFSPMMSCLFFLYSHFPAACAVARDPTFARAIVILASRIPVEPTADDPSIPLSYYTRNLSLRMIWLATAIVRDCPGAVDPGFVIMRFVDFVRAVGPGDRAAWAALEVLGTAMGASTSIDKVAGVLRLFEDLPVWFETRKIGRFLRLVAVWCRKGEEAVLHFSEVVRLDEFCRQLPNIHSDGLSDYFDVLCEIIKSENMAQCIDFAAAAKRMAGNEARAGGAFANFFNVLFHNAAELFGAALEHGVIDVLIGLLDEEFPVKKEAVRAIHSALAVDREGMSGIVVDCNFVGHVVDMLEGADGDQLEGFLDALDTAVSVAVGTANPGLLAQVTDNSVGVALVGIAEGESKCCEMATAIADRLAAL
jgi:hypothetical protein